MDTMTPAERSVRMGLIRSRDTKPELAVRRLVRSLGFRYRLHVKDLPGCPDLVIKRLGKVIFVNGWLLASSQLPRLQATEIGV